MKPILCDYMEKEDYGDLRERNGIEKGIERGREEGIKRGREEGIKRGRGEGIKRGREEGIKRGREEGIEGSVKLLRDCGIPDSEIVMKIMNQYNLTLDKAQSYLRFI